MAREWVEREERDTIRESYMSSGVGGLPMGVSLRADGEGGW